MSLINQMLKDLEERKNTSVQPERLLTGLAPSFGQGRAAKINPWLRWGAWVLLFIWGVNIVLYYRSHHPSLVVSKRLVPVKTTTPVVKRQSVPVAPTSAAAITGITMQVHGKMTYLRFLLNREVFYRVNSDPLEHTITLVFNRAVLAVNPPPLDYKQGAIQDLKVNTEDKGELKIILYLKPDAKLSNLELNKESKYPELQADFLLEKPERVAEQTNWEKQSSPQLKKTPVEPSGEERYQAALNLAREGDVDQAIQRLAFLVDQFPAYSAARVSLITLLTQRGDEDQADEILETGLRLQPYYPPFVEMRARLLVDEGKVHQALHLLKKAPPSMASNPEYYAFLAALYQRLGQLPAAENLYQQLTALHPEKGAWWLGLGVTEEGLGKSSQAMEAYARADSSPDLDPELRGYVGSRLRG